MRLAVLERMAHGPEKHQSGTANEEQGKIAVDWCRKAAAGGFAPAQLSLSYETPDPAEAYKLKRISRT